MFLFFLEDYKVETKVMGKLSFTDRIQALHPWGYDGTVKTKKYKDLCLAKLVSAHLYGPEASENTEGFSAAGLGVSKIHLPSFIDKNKNQQWY